MCVASRDYVGSVIAIGLSETYAAVLTDGSVTIHAIESAEDSEDEWHVPPKGHQPEVTAMGMTSHFLVTGTSRGNILYHLLEERAVVNEYRHEDCGIRRIFPQPEGTRSIFEDDSHMVYLFNPVNDQVLPIPDFNGVVDNVVWDCEDTNLFALFDSNNIYVYSYLPVTISGPKISLLTTQTKNSGLSPILLANGQLTGQLQSGALEQVTLETHQALQDEAVRTGGPQALRRRFDSLLAMGDLKAAWEVAFNLKNDDVWHRLCNAALDAMDVDLAIWIFRNQGNASMVLSLERIRHIEDKNLLAGHLLVLKDGDYNTAQELFLRSSFPKAALEMRKDLKHWDEAMKLAQQLDPDSIGEISRKYAGMLEVRGDFPTALDYYQQAQDLCAGDPEVEAACQGGIARCTLHMGDIRRQIALASNNPSLCRECGSILESMNQLQDAAEMYEKGGLFEKAASIYIQNKSFQQVAPLMAKISSPKLHLQYAKAKEGEGKFQEAVAAYEAAGEMDSVVRLNLERLKNPHKAFAVVRKTRSSEGASMVANFCISNGDYSTAIEFLLLARRNQEAFEFAQAHNSMDAYVQFAGEGISSEEWARVARFYESSGRHDKAGDMWSNCSQYEAALRAYVKGGPEALDKAISMVGKANNPSLTNQLVDFLMGETDGEAKDHNYLFKLHMALGNYEQAAQTSVLIAKQEQEMGNYKLAHSQLFETFRELRSQKRRIPAELTRSLMLLHSYILVKTLARIGDHESAARMLIRVARNISKFPEHIVPILTSTVIECQRAGFRKTAFEYASMLVRPEYRNQLRPEYKRKIENMVRKPDKDAADAEEPTWPCPFCRTPGPETELECGNCRDVIPFCIATGKRCIVSDWGRCPHCHFNCRIQDLSKILVAESKCPMCSSKVTPNEVQKITDPVGLLREEEAAVEREANGSAQGEDSQ
uniref:Wd repeat-containing protein 19 n=2 Tax=Tetraselmis sp. GSL018 TaxID=582737 RepID=A0A061RSU0_9CHLO